jgi:hypothetical protein
MKITSGCRWASFSNSSRRALNARLRSSWGLGISRLGMAARAMTGMMRSVGNRRTSDSMSAGSMAAASTLSSLLMCWLMASTMPSKAL